MTYRLPAIGMEVGKWSLLAFVVLALLIPVASAFAQAEPPPYEPLPNNKFTDPKGTIRTIGGTVANVIGTIVLAVSVIMILYAAFLFLTAGGDSERVTSARNTLIYALVGVAVALVAFALPGVVQRLFT